MLTITALQRNVSQGLHQTAALLVLCIQINVTRRDSTKLDLLHFQFFTSSFSVAENGPQRCNPRSLTTSATSLISRLPSIFGSVVPTPGSRYVLLPAFRGCSPFPSGAHACRALALHTLSVSLYLHFASAVRGTACTDRV